MSEYNRCSVPTAAAMRSSLSTPFIRLMPMVFSVTAVRMLLSAPGSAPYFSATISRSAPCASCGVQTTGRKISPLIAQPWRRRSARLPSAMTPN